MRARLERGGSFSDIGPLLAHWKVETHYRSKSLPSGVPESLNDAVNAFAAQVWAAARQEAEKLVEHERAKLAELEREHEKEAVAAWSEVDRLTAEVAELRGQLRAAGAGLAGERQPGSETGGAQPRRTDGQTRGPTLPGDRGTALRALIGLPPLPDDGVPVAAEPPGDKVREPGTGLAAAIGKLGPDGAERSRPRRRGRSSRPGLPRGWRPRRIFGTTSCRRPLPCSAARDASSTRR